MAAEPVPPRVWLACDWFVKYTVGLAAGLAEIGCEVTLLTRRYDAEFGGEEGAMRAHVAAELGDRVRHLSLGGRVSDPRCARAVARLRGEAKRTVPDVVHFQDSVANDVRLVLASGVPPRRYALTVHDPVPHPGDAVAKRSTRLARTRLRHRAGLLFVHSEELREELRGTGVGAVPIEVVPHGVAAPRPQRFPERDSLLFFGRISHYKGLDVLLDAMPLVWERRPELTLTVAGGADGVPPRHPVLEDTRVTARIEHVPEEALPQLFGDSSCLVLPYRQASQSGVGSLAREYGRGVIATRVGGLPELVAPEWGRLVAPEDPAALAAAILEVVETPGRAAAMGEAAAASLGEAAWPAVAEATVAAYRRHLL